MNLHAIQTGSVRIKSAQVKGQGRGLRGRLGVFADPSGLDGSPCMRWSSTIPKA
jgi:hypothetical protein